MAWQQHGPRVAEARPTGIVVAGAVFEQCDGFWTEEPGQAMTLVTADCLPVAVCRTDGAPALCVLHVGWRGLLAGIVGAGVDALGEPAARGDRRPGHRPVLLRGGGRGGAAVPGRLRRRRRRGRATRPLDGDRARAPGGRRASASSASTSAPPATRSSSSRTAATRDGRVGRESSGMWNSDAIRAAYERLRVGGRARRHGRRRDEVRARRGDRSARRGRRRGRRREPSSRTSRRSTPASASAFRWHFIGHLQSRKAPLVSSLCELVHSLDSLSAARRLTIPALVEVNLSGEETKSGVPAAELGCVPGPAAGARRRGARPDDDAAAHRGPGDVAPVLPRAGAASPASMASGSSRWERPRTTASRSRRARRSCGSVPACSIGNILGREWVSATSGTEPSSTSASPRKRSTGTRTSRRRTSSSGRTRTGRTCDGCTGPKPAKEDFDDWSDPEPSRAPEPSRSGRAAGRRSRPSPPAAGLAAGPPRHAAELQRRAVDRRQVQGLGAGDPQPPERRRRAREAPDRLLERPHLRAERRHAACRGQGVPAHAPERRGVRRGDGPACSSAASSTRRDQRVPLADAISTAVRFVTSVYYVYLLLIFVYILLSWIPLPYNAWLSRFQRFLYDVVNPYLARLPAIPADAAGWAAWASTSRRSSRSSFSRPHGG